MHNKDMTILIVLAIWFTSLASFANILSRESHTLRQKVVMVSHALIIPVIFWLKWSIQYVSLSAMFKLLHSKTNQELYEKHLCNESSHYEKVPCTPCCAHQLSSEKWGIHYTSLSTMFNLLHGNMNQELPKNHLCKYYAKYRRCHVPHYCTEGKASIVNYCYSAILVKKHLCNQGSHNEKYGQFLFCKGSHHIQPPNRHLLLSAKMNGTQRRTMVSPWRMYCSVHTVVCQKAYLGLKQCRCEEWKNQTCSISCYQVMLVWKHNIAVRKFSNQKKEIR